MSMLKPCPFCGGPAVNVAGEYITCGAPAFLDCVGRTIRADVEAWNSRTPEPAPQDNAEIVERCAKAYADATGYYVPFHRGLSSPSADKVRVGIAAAIRALATPIQGEIR